MCLLNSEIIVDNFAGWGGASHGLFLASGRHPAVAVNHWRTGIRIHTVNHPDTEHFVEDVWNIDPVEACGGKEVGLAWFSPDCTHFSRARGAAPDRPKSAKIRALAWVVHRWARAVLPRIMIIENVKEILTWGPLKDGQPIKEKAGQTWKKWWNRIIRLGYRGSYRTIKAHHHGEATTRERLFIVFRRDEYDIEWPEATHGPEGSGLLPFERAADRLDFSIPCPSIFLTKEEGKKLGIRRPLADPTLARIGRGFWRHVAEDPDPFVVPGTDGQFPMPAILVQTGYGERKDAPGCKAQKTRILDIKQPIGAMVACGIKHAVAAAKLVSLPFVVKNNGGNENDGQHVRESLDTVTTRDSKSLATGYLIKLRNNCDGASLKGPIDAITAGGTHHGNVRVELIPAESLSPAMLAGARKCFAFLMKYNGTQQFPDIKGPSPTITCTEGLSLIQVVCVTLPDGDYIVVDIGMRMLTPRELARCQGFPDSYVMELPGVTKEDQVRGVGNSVCPKVAAAVARANLFPKKPKIGFPGKSSSRYVN
jgi:DNA (cytosine-5)-methyltransferase 1